MVMPPLASVATLYISLTNPIWSVALINDSLFKGKAAKIARTAYDPVTTDAGQHGLVLGFGASLCCHGSLIRQLGPSLHEKVRRSATNGIRMRFRAGAHSPFALAGTAAARPGETPWRVVRATLAWNTAQRPIPGK